MQEHRGGRAADPAQREGDAVLVCEVQAGGVARDAADYAHERQRHVWPDLQLVEQDHWRCVRARPK